MSEKWEIVGKDYIGDIQGEAYIITNKKYLFSIYEDEDEVEKLLHLLNALSDENEQLKESNKNSEKRFIYILENYPFYDGSSVLFVSENRERTLAEFEKIEKKKGYGYLVIKYPIDVFCDDSEWFGEIVKHQEVREDGLYEWNGDDWVKK